MNLMWFYLAALMAVIFICNVSGYVNGQDTVIIHGERF